MPDPVITVTPTIQSGTVVRWYRSTDDNERPVVSASRDGVMIHGDVFLHDLPAEWLRAARKAHADLDEGRSILGMATHQRRGLFSPLEPVGGSDAT